MQLPIHPTTTWKDKLFAALIFFTRLPFWRIYQPQKEAYAHVVELWPLTGWLTATLTAATMYGCAQIMPTTTAIILAFVMRLLLTGALHEDGLADFLDGFGAGRNDAQQTLRVMKDSHIGTYGVLGLILYVALLFTTLSQLPITIAALVVLAADPFAKMMAAQITQMLPYARTAEQAKNKVIYRAMSTKGKLLLAIQGLLPLTPLCWYVGLPYECIVLPGIVFYMLYQLMRRKINGYTGDCCGALFLIVELSFVLSFVVFYYQNNPFAT